MGVRVQTQVSIKFGSHEYIRTPVLNSWRESNCAFSLRRDSSYLERTLCELLDHILEDAKTTESTGSGS